VELYERTKKMVVIAYHHRVRFGRYIAICRRTNGRSTFCIYPLLMSNRKTYESLFVICVGLGVIAWLKKNEWLAIVDAALLVVGLIATPFRKLIHELWWKLAAILGYINGKIIFSIFFVLLVIPIGLISQWMSKKAIIEDTNFKPRNHLYTAEDLKHIF